MKQVLFQSNIPHRFSIIFCYFVFLFSAGTTIADTVRDEFSTISYTNNDGTANWATNWLEITEADGASAGDIQVMDNQGSNRLRISGNNKGVQREVNLSGATVATLTFDYRRESLDRGNEYVNLEISSDGGVSWTELIRFKGPQNDVSYQSQLPGYDITSYISANTRIRLLGSANLDNADAVYFDNIEINYSSPSLTHFAISHDGTGDNCLPEQIIITKHTAAHAIDASYTGTITLTTSTSNGNWTKTTTATDAEGTLSTGAIDSGSATYTFVTADNGSITLNLANTNIETLNINITDGSDTENATEDPDLIFSNLNTTTYRDEFSSPSYANNDGTATWATDWLEIVEADGATAGDVQVNSSEQLQVSGSNKGAQRAVDLTGATAATLSLDHRRVSLENGNEYVNLEISSDGGANWIQLDRFKGPQNDVSTQSTSYNITPYISATTRIRLLGSTSLDSTTDVVYFDNIEIASSFVVACSSVDHFSINYFSGTTGSGINCQAESITVAVHDASHTVLTTYTGSITLATSTNNGDWSKTAIITDANGTLISGIADSGSATYSFITADNGSVILNLKNTHTETTNLNINGNSILETSNAAVASDDFEITFASSGFIFNNDTDSNTIIPTQLSGKDSDVGYHAKAITLQAVRKSDSDPTRCTAAFQNKTLNIDFAAECQNPSSCVTGQLFTLNGSTLTATTNDNLVIGSSNYDTRSVTFDVNGKYNLVFNYPETGLIELHARHNILLADGTTPSGNYMSGESSFVVRPLGLSLDVSGQRAADYIDNAILDDSTGTNTSYALDASGSFFKKAGEDFTATITAVQWQATDDVNNDGIADTDANLTDNISTQNFGNETTAVTPANVTLVQTTILPNTGTLTNSANSASFINGVGTKTFSLSEVGIFDLTATLSNYLSSGQDIVTTTPSFGRFSPDHFCVSANTVINRTDTVTAGTCTDNFSFLGEEFDANFRITAQAAGSICGSADKTQNYTGSYNKFSTPFTSDDTSTSNDSGTWNLAAINDPSGTPLNLNNRITINNTLSSVINNNGSMDVSAQIKIGRTGSAPNYNAEAAMENIHIGINPIDTDGIGLATTNLVINAANYFDVGTTTLYFGRLYADNAYGPELTALPMWIKTQYCNSAVSNACADWISISNDSCTLFSISPPTDAAIGNATAGDGSGYYKRLISAPEYDFTNSSGFVYTPDTNNHSTGFNLFYTAGGTGGEYIIPFATHNYLITQSGTASFGLYRGDDRIIYWREVF